LEALLVATYGYADSVYYRARVAAGEGSASRVGLELAQVHFRVGLDLLLPANLGALYLIKLVGSVGATPDRLLIIGIPFCLLGLILVALWRYARETERS
jgi:hypothetical protein